MKLVATLTLELITEARPTLQQQVLNALIGQTLLMNFTQVMKLFTSLINVALPHVLILNAYTVRDFDVAFI